MSDERPTLDYARPGPSREQPVRASWSVGAFCALGIAVILLIAVLLALRWIVIR